MLVYGALTLSLSWHRIVQSSFWPVPKRGAHTYRAAAKRNNEIKSNYERKICVLAIAFIVASRVNRGRRQLKSIIACWLLTFSRFHCQLHSYRIQAHEARLLRTHTRHNRPSSYPHNNGIVNTYRINYIEYRRRRKKIYKLSNRRIIKWKRFDCEHDRWTQTASDFMRQCHIAFQTN